MAQMVATRDMPNLRKTLCISIVLYSCTPVYSTSTDAKNSDEFRANILDASTDAVDCPTPCPKDAPYEVIFRPNFHQVSNGSIQVAPDPGSLAQQFVYRMFPNVANVASGIFDIPFRAGESITGLRIEMYGDSTTDCQLEVTYAANPVAPWHGLGLITVLNFQPTWQTYNIQPFESTVTTATGKLGGFVACTSVVGPIYIRQAIATFQRQ